MDRSIIHLINIKAHPRNISTHPVNVTLRMTLAKLTHCRWMLGKMETSINNLNNKAMNRKRNNDVEWKKKHNQKKLETIKQGE
jgi:type II secretory pathway component PulC